MDKTKRAFEDARVNVKMKLSALWVTVMFCYIYADILGLYDKWLLGEILKGNMGPLGPITQELKLGVAILMSIPALMVFLSIVLKPKINRWANIISGSLLTIVIFLTLVMAFTTEPWAYYVYFASIEIPITLFIVWSAWKWPTQKI
jgi:hypothetical protein